MDMVTGEKSKHEGARILVEVDLDKPIVDKVSILMPDGRIWDQVVDFEIKPVVCKSCKALGHEDCHMAESSIHGAARGRSRARRARSKKPNTQGSEKGKEAETLNPKVSMLSEVSSLGKGKEKLNEEECVNTPRVENVWQMVAYKKASPPPTTSTYASVVLNGSSNKLQESVVGAIPIATRPKKLVDDALPISPNTFGPLFDEEEMTHQQKEVRTIERMKEAGSKSANPNKVRVLGEMEEEVPGVARGRGRISLSP